MPVVALPKPLKFIARLLAATALVLWLSHTFQRALLEPMIPVFRAAVPALDAHFTMLSTDISHEGPNEALRFRANLNQPILVGGQTVYPFGWGSVPAGGFQVTVTLGGMLQYCAFMLILILAWPAQHAREFATRLLIALPLMGILLLIDVPFTVLAEFWNAIQHDLEPQAIQPLMVWSRFLMGGGGLVMAAILGILAVVAAGSVESLIRSDRWVRRR